LSRKRRTLKLRLALVPLRKLSIKSKRILHSTMKQPHMSMNYSKVLLPILGIINSLAVLPLK
jgi:hypothetical protein